MEALSPDGASEVRIVRLADHEWKTVTGIYSVAFLDDAFTTGCLLLDERRMPGFFEPLIRMGLSAEGSENYAIYCDGQPVSAVTLLPPGWQADARVAAASLAEMRRRVGFRTSWRVTRMLQASSLLPKPEGHVSHLLFMATLPEYRRRGFARRLLSFLDQRSLEIGAEGIYLEVVTGSPAMPVYLDHGYHEIGRARVINAEIAVLLNPLTARAVPPSEGEQF